MADDYEPMSTQQDDEEEQRQRLLAMELPLSAQSVTGSGPLATGRGAMLGNGASLSGSTIAPPPEKPEASAALTSIAGPIAPERPASITGEFLAGANAHPIAPTRPAEAATAGTSVTGMKSLAPPPVPTSVTAPINPLGATPSPLSATPPNPRPMLGKLQSLQAQGAPELHGIKKFFDVLSQAFPIGQAIEAAIPGSPGNYQRKLGEATSAANEEEKIAKEQGTEEETQARTEEQRTQAQKNLAPVAPKIAFHYPDTKGNEIAVYEDGTTKSYPGGAPAKPEDIKAMYAQAVQEARTKGIDPNTDAGVQQLAKAVQALEKPEKGHTSPFEAFAYGTPQEKKAAQDFINLEGRQKLLDRPPSEVEQKYRLYQADPEAYKAMFGNKAETGDQAQAARMLKFFDARRKGIQNDFMLSDEDKQKQLSEIDELEKPYLAAASTGGAGGGNAGGNQPKADEVLIQKPNGEQGYIPRANLPKAVKRGWKQVNP